jgi:hypothetical protein
MDFPLVVKMTFRNCMSRPLGFYLSYQERGPDSKHG